MGGIQSLLRTTLLLVVGLQAGSAAAQQCAAVGQLYSIDGEVSVQRQGAWQRGVLNQTLCAHDGVRTGSLSRAAVMLSNENVLRIDQNTTMYLTNIVTEEQKPSLLDLTRGAFQSFSRQPHALEVNTPYLNAAVQGTEFVIRAEAGEATLTTYEGVVRVSNKSGSTSVASGQSVSAAAGRAPRPFILVKPWDAVQWGLYYPPILALGGADSSKLRPELAASLERAKQHDIAGALKALDRIPAGERDGSFYLLEAALLLSVGRVDEALKIINEAIARNDRAGLAYALRAVIEVVKNQKARALEDAKRGVGLEPKAAAPRIALSYAQQANFDLKDARDTLLEATQLQPQNALAWARLGELWLMFGYRKRAREAAENGVQLAPDLERVHLVFGFAALTEFRTKVAREAFARAIELDSADPLARFGLGLAIIRDGALHEGRRYLEMAVGLDSTNSLLRSYLGKAYFEEKRDPLDAKQFAIAKALDPLDPTPYLYDAIRLQSINRPVDAMLNMEKSIELNDNRAVYRSRQLLDSDRATRGANLAQIYNNLGFEQLGLNQGYDSLMFAPDNSAAHRFLSDAYIGVPRREIARVSELFQAQMLQDININPVQPSLAETNLSLLARGGPFVPGLNEYTPLFERNDIQFVGAGLLGNENTRGLEGIASALYDRFSISAGAFHYDTDGWRPNAGFEHDIENLFMQAAVTPDFNVQLELRHRESDQGFLAFNFDPDTFLPGCFGKAAALLGECFLDTRETDTARVGLRYSPSPNSDVLLSYIHSDEHDETTFVPDFPSVTDLDGSQLEAQYIYRGEWLNLIAGLGNTDVSTLVGNVGSEKTPGQLEHRHGYVYTEVKFPRSITWTVGASDDDFQNVPIEVNKISPKFGVRWDITPNLSVRAASFEWVKPPLIADRTLEPTQVSGFNQVFDNSNGDDARRRGVGIDWQITKKLFGGAEATWRDIEVPLELDPSTALFEKWKEQLHRAYLYWAPFPRVSLSGEIAYDTFESELGLLTSASSVPQSLRTVSVPVGLRYFDPSGFFAGVLATYIDQDVVRTPEAKEFLGLSDGRENFVVVDASIGWRFPKRIGIAALTVRNLFDQKFRYQDDNFREFRNEPSATPYVPERQIVGRVTLYF
jgi:tetratricopeptide (TPR) repeat protein